MTEKNDFKLDVVSIRLVKEAPIYSEQSFNKPEEVAAVMGDCMCQFDREVVCVVNLSSDLKPINVHFASVGSLNEAMAHPKIWFCTDIKAVSVFRVHFIFDFAKSRTNAGGKSFKQYFAKSITKEIVIKVFDRTPRSDVTSPTL